MLILLILLKTITFLTLAELAIKYQRPNYCAIFYTLIVMLAFSITYKPAFLIYATLCHLAIALPIFHQLANLREYPFQRSLLMLLSWLCLVILPSYFTRDIMEWEFAEIVRIIYAQAVSLAKTLTW